MYTIEHAYELADQYTAKTNGFTKINIARWNHNMSSHTPHEEYSLYAQALNGHEEFLTIDALVERLKELLA